MDLLNTLQTTVMENKMVVLAILAVVVLAVYFLYFRGSAPRVPMMLTTDEAEGFSGGQQARRAEEDD